MSPRETFASYPRKAMTEAPPAHATGIFDTSSAAGLQAQPASDQDIESRGTHHHFHLAATTVDDPLLTDAADVAGPAHRDRPNEEESASANPATTISVESNDSTGGTESSVHLTPTPARNIADSRTSREVSPGRSIFDRLGLNATPGSPLQDPSGSGPMLENSPNDAVETSVSVFADTLLDFGLVCGRRIGLLEGTKILVETRMMDLRAEMDKAWSSIKEGRNCERGFDAIESDLKLLAEAKSDVDEAVQDAENEFQTYRLAFIDKVQAASRHLAQV
ncbi:hypothetical protein CGCA056_v014929 [Colletotrichum aenigma]|uniref:uncharacterized protein n=1 Tax=Colletotrichum aenigma TaxID=1215731 RepID=UPI001872E5B1|nr:uncharacterized protein CGCA056_v014929 [Colletotrichum aenigma]KAF5501909.1 hypothetical protein CGCA056_v014929 [Colletotrichum aenigma]